MRLKNGFRVSGLEMTLSYIEISRRMCRRNWFFVLTGKPQCEMRIKLLNLNDFLTRIQYYLCCLKINIVVLTFYSHQLSAVCTTGLIIK